MQNEPKIILQFDEVADVLYVLREGYDSDALINTDSEKVTGFVKRIDPASGECVGFYILGFVQRFPQYSDRTDEDLKSLMDISLKLTNESTSITGAKAA